MQKRNPPCKVRLTTIFLSLMIILLPGCDSRSRHKTLNFFFTGVPPLEEDVAKREEKTAQDVVDKPPGVMLSTHSYFARRMCSKCHQQTTAIVSGSDSQTSREPASAPGRSPDPALILDLGICLKCHENPFAAKESLELQTHAPVRCAVCHVPHQSEYPYLLKSEASEICTMCHMDDNRSGKDFHVAPLKRDYSD